MSDRELKWQGDFVEGEYVAFVHVGQSATNKTMIWDVQTRDQEPTVLGVVKWLGRWRQYSFFPYPDMVFEKTCLRDIAQFLIDLMQLRKEQKAA